MKARSILACAAAAALLAACGDRAGKAAQADANAAAFVPPSVTTRVDYGTRQERRFARLDKDGDGVLAATEMPRDRPRVIALDRNKDGRITSSEFGEGQMARFDAMDLNHDAILTSDERVDARAE